MGRVTSLFARKVVEAINGPVDRDEILRVAGLQQSESADATHAVEDVDYYRLFELAAAADSDPTTLPLRVGAAMRCDDYGAFGLAWKSATTLRNSYDRAERYALVLTNVSRHEVEKTFQGAYLHLHREGPRRLGLRLSNEATLASITAISREVSSKPFQTEGVYLRHEAPESISDHENYFGCPVHFGSDRDALLVSEQTLQTPNKLGDATIASFFDAHLQAAVKRLDDTRPLHLQVRERVAISLSEGVPLLSDIAKALGMSGRTLQRRLAEQDHSYQALVDASRRGLAVRLLRETDYSLIDVTFMTGFSEQSAFSRAFKRWAGQTPRAFRLGGEPESPPK